MSEQMIPGITESGLERISTSNVQKEIEIRTDSSQYNQGTKTAQLYHEELNTASNWHIITKAFKDGRARDITDEPKVPFTSEKPPCIIVGSGPSLDIAIPLMKDWKGGIICTTSQALTLMRFGIEPTHILALDCFASWEEIQGVDWSKTRTKLIAHPGVWPSLIENWPNEMLMYIENLGKQDSFYATTQKRMYSHRTGAMRTPTFNYYIRTEITLFACSPPLQLFAAELLGYGTIFLSGVDLGYPHGKERFTGYTPNPDGTWDKHEHLFENIPKQNITMYEKDPPPRELIISKNGVYTEVIHVYYKKNFLSAWQLSGKTMYTMDNGIITEIPFAPPKKVMKRQGYGYKPQSIEFIENQTQPYLASVRAFVVETDKGKSFVECQNPSVDLVEFMKQINRRFMCSKCGVRLTANDDNTPPDATCPQCKEGKLLHEVTVDIEANMRRIYRHLDAAKKL